MNFIFLKWVLIFWVVAVTSVLAHRFVKNKAANEPQVMPGAPTGLTIR